MPFAIFVPHGSTEPVILALSDCQKLLAALRLLARSAPRDRGGLEDMPDADAARRWLETLDEPSGWYETVDEAADRLRPLGAGGTAELNGHARQGQFQSRKSAE
jgi:hypothetical protein